MARRKMKIPLFIYLLSSMVYFISGLLGPIYAIFVEGIGGDILETGISYAIYMITMGLTYILFGSASDKLGVRVPFMFIGLIFQGFAILLYIFVENTIQLFMVQVIMGIAGSLYIPAFDALSDEYIDERYHGAMAWGLLEGSEDISYGLASLVGGVLAHLFGFVVLFTAMAILTFFSAFYSLKLAKKGEFRLFMQGVKLEFKKSFRSLSKLLPKRH